MFWRSSSCASARTAQVLSRLSRSPSPALRRLPPLSAGCLVLFQIHTAVHISDSSSCSRSSSVQLLFCRSGLTQSSQRTHQLRGLRPVDRGLVSESPPCSLLTSTLIAKVETCSDAGPSLQAPFRSDDKHFACVRLDTPHIRDRFLSLLLRHRRRARRIRLCRFQQASRRRRVRGSRLEDAARRHRHSRAGRRTLVRAIAGARLIETASAYLSGSLPFVWELIIGISFIVVIVVLPRGLFGGLRDVLGATARAKLSEPSAITLETAGRTAPVSSAQDVVVEVAGLSKSFGSLSVLSDVSFSARRGELVSLVGPNGAGKTTLIRCLADGGERSDGSVKIMGGRSTACRRSASSPLDLAANSRRLRCSKP